MTTILHQSGEVSVNEQNLIDSCKIPTVASLVCGKKSLRSQQMQFLRSKCMEERNSGQERL